MRLVERSAVQRAEDGTETVDRRRSVGLLEGSDCGSHRGLLEVGIQGGMDEFLDLGFT